MKGEVPLNLELQKKINLANLQLQTDSNEGRKLAIELEAITNNEQQVSYNEQVKSIILSSYYMVGDTTKLRDTIDSYWNELKAYNSETFKGVLFQYQACYLYLTKQMDEAKAMIEKAIVIFKSNHEHKRVIQSYHLQGSILSSNNELVESFKAFDKFLESCEDFPEIDSSYHLTALLNMGFLFIHAKDYKEALVLIEDSLKLIKESGNSYPYILLATYVNQASCNFYLNRVDEMPGILRSAEKMQESLQSNHHKSHIYSLWAEYYYCKGDFSKAEENILLSTNGKLKSTKQEFFPSDLHLVQYCELKSKLGQFEDVEDLLKDFCAIFEELEMDFEKELQFVKIAGLYTTEGKYKLASKYYTKWLDLQRKLQPEKEKLREYKVRHQERLKAKRKEYNHNEAIDQKNKELGNFIRMASHDMKSPLKNIRQFGELLGKGEIDKEQKEYLEFIAESSDKLDRLLMDLLEYTNVEFKKDNLSEIDLASIVKEARAELEPLTKEFELQIELKDVLSFRSDINGIETLISNMLKHCISMMNPKTDSFIHISCRDLDDFIQIIIEDNGIGIEETQLANIFDPFTRLQLSYGHSENSLKLATCKRIVEKLGGQIAVESTKEFGSKFLISLPKN